MKQIQFMALAILFAVIGNSLKAQDKWSIEFRPDINFPTEDFGDSKISTGYGFELTGAYLFMEHLSAYAGWSYDTFSIEDSDFDFDETGYSFGFQLIHPLGTSQTLSYLLRAGATYKHLELENRDGDITSDSDRGLGYQLEGGLNYDLGTNFNLRPTLRYSALSRDLDVDGITLNLDLKYLSFGLGISKTF